MDFSPLLGADERGTKTGEPLKVVDAEIEFVRGVDGRVTGLVLHQGGRDVPGKRK